MKVNQLKAGVILSYIAQAISILSGLIYTPIMLRLLGQSQYGVYQLAASTISYLGLLSLGFGSSYVRYYTRYKIKNDLQGIARLNGMFMSIFCFVGIICAIAGTILISNIDEIFRNSLSQDEINTAKILMTFMIFNLSISFPGSVFCSYITANEQYIFQRVVSILSGILNPFLTLPLLLLGYKSIGMVVIQTLLAILSLIANWTFCLRKLEIRFDFKKFEWKFLKELFMFSFWIFLNQIIDQINWSVDKFVLGVVSGTVTVAIYGVASSLNSLYLSFSTAISGVFVPRVNKIVADTNDNKLLTDLFTRVGRIQFILLALIVSGLVIFGKYFIGIWAGVDYQNAYSIALLLIIPVTIPLIQNLGIEIQRAKNMHQFRSIIYFIIAILNIGMSIPLSKYYGGVGAAAGTAIALLLGNGLIMNIFYHRKIGLDIMYFWRQIGKFLPALLIPSIVGFIIIKYINFRGIMMFIMCIIGYVIIYGLSMWFIGMNQSEKDVILNPLKRILNGRK